MADLKPTDAEMEILKVLWQKEWSSVREVHEALQHKESGYTTTLKLMQIMSDKGLVERNTESRTHLYRALHTQEKARRSLLDKIINTAFDGSASQLVMQALGQKKTSQKELRQIREYLDELERNRS